jgi:hypothetical protein
MYSPVSNFCPDSTRHHTNNDYIREPYDNYSSHPPMCVSESDPSNTVQHFRHFQNILCKTTAAIERRNVENHLLKNELKQFRSTRPLCSQIPSNTSYSYLNYIYSYLNNIQLFNYFRY